MKRILLIMMAFMASFSVYAQEVNTENVEEMVEITYDSNWPIINTVYLDGDYILKNTVTITAPLALTPSDIITVYDSIRPSLPLSYWSIANGILTITYHSGDLTEIAGPGEAYIYIYTRAGGYRIQLIIS